MRQTGSIRVPPDGHRWRCARGPGAEVTIGGVKWCVTCGREVALRTHHRRDGTVKLVRSHVGLWGMWNGC